MPPRTIGARPALIDTQAFLGQTETRSIDAPHRGTEDLMPARGSLALLPRTKKGVVLFWTALFLLSIALQYAAAMAPQRALALSGAIYTSNFDGTVINKNHYDTKPDVYLTGGPCQGGSHLDPGDYYFEVSNPNTAALLSTDAIGNRKFTVAANGFISGTSGTH